MLKGTYFVIDDDATAAEDDDLNARMLEHILFSEL